MSRVWDSSTRLDERLKKVAIVGDGSKSRDRWPRCRVRRRRAASRDPFGPPPPPSDDRGSEVGGLCNEVSGDEDATAVASTGPAARLWCVINRSFSIERREDDLCRHVLFALVIGNGQVPHASELVAEIARCFNLKANSLELHCTRSEGFLLILSDEVVADLIYSEVRPVSILSSSRLHFTRWTRHAFSTGAVLSDLVDIKLHGIPDHAWELSTMEQLLNEYCWTSDLHPNTTELCDRISFRVRAWCFQPCLIPNSMELLIAEPTVILEEDPPIKRVMAYPIDISMRPALQPLMNDSPPPPVEDDQGHQTLSSTPTWCSAPRHGGRSQPRPASSSACAAGVMFNC